MFTLAHGPGQPAQHQQRHRWQPTHLGVLLGVLLPIGVAICVAGILASGSPQWPASKTTDCAIPAAKTVRPLCADNRGVRPSPRPFKGAAAPPVYSLF